jgi:hypothetical protein
MEQNVTQQRRMASCQLIRTTTVYVAKSLGEHCLHNLTLHDND